MRACRRSLQARRLAAEGVDVAIRSCKRLPPDLHADSCSPTPCCRCARQPWWSRAAHPADLARFPLIHYDFADLDATRRRSGPTGLRWRGSRDRRDARPAGERGRPRARRGGVRGQAVSLSLKLIASDDVHSGGWSRRSGPNCRCRRATISSLPQGPRDAAQGEGLPRLVCSRKWRRPRRNGRRRSGRMLPNGCRRPGGGHAGVG